MITTVRSTVVPADTFAIKTLPRLRRPSSVCFSQGFRFDLDRKMDLIGKFGEGCFFMVRPTKDSLSQGEVLFDPASVEAKVPPQHLVIMVNGIIGSSADWKYASEQFVKMLPDKVIVHRSECNYSKLTLDGVDLMGERLAKEVLFVVEHWPDVKKISFVAHSLGGLVARYAIGRLYEHQPCYSNDNEGRIAGLEPINFITFATPHLGSRGHKQLPFLCGLPFLERRAPQTAHLIAGRSGKHLFLTDNDGTPPLLLRMVSDSHDLKFISALRAFKRRVAYANVNYDYVVGWRTSSIRRQHELPQPNLLMKDKKYPHVMYVEQGNLKHINTKIETHAIDLEEEMIRGLNEVPWERVDISFHESSQRYVAHTTIQVKSYWLNSDGADVVLHMIDNFML
ncbi:putative lipase ROG1 [Impatiens glandulifera]|uniref:putative lipase ROG1 n=1 Tax=Impatiens glandulifera TaxID=253017 RepID=UPI001FB191DF|nr:putative lipase ROG1 [Impatiens glandulifera]